ncbi:MAG: MATE family efflux transporter [Crocinitomicaceae bacterium]
MLSLTNKSILKVAAPIMIGTFVQNIVMITDAVLVEKLGTASFNAANNAGLLYVVFFMLIKGFGDGTQIQIAKEYGLKQPAAINFSLNHAFVVQLFLAIILTAFLYVSLPIFTNNFVKDESTGNAMKEFLHYRMWGLLFASIQISAMAFFIGIGKTKIIMLSSVLLAVLNIFLDVGLIYGYFGFPKMGVGGAGLASTISEAVTAIVLALLLIKSKFLKGFEYSWPKQFSKRKFQKLLKLSYPLMLSGFLSIATWYVFFSLIEQRNAFDLEVSHVVRNLFFIAFIPIFGFAATARTYVSYYYAKGDNQMTILVIKKIIILSIAGFLLFFHGALFYPKFLLGLISSSPEVIDEGVNLLKMVFGSMLLFSIVSVLYQTVAAIGKTLQSLYIELASIFIYLIFAYLLIIKWNVSILAVWSVEFLYFGITGALSFIYLKYYQKKIKHSYES